MKSLAALFWICFAVAWWSYANGNPTAANGIVGAGICAVACTVLAFIERPS